jgi:hypothetical protein
MCLALTATPHTTHEPHVREMRDLTWCSYASLIVDTRNITGRHLPGNAWAPLPKVTKLKIAGLLQPQRRDQVAGRRSVPAMRRGNIDAFASHTPVRSDVRLTTCRFPRSTRNHRSIMVRRNIVPQPLLVLGVVLGRNIIALVKRRPRQRIPENLVNWVARPRWTVRHSRLPV